MGMLARRLRTTLPLLLDLLLVVFLSTLDIRDLYYKVAYLGPFNSFSFYAISQRTIKTKDAVPTADLSLLTPGESTTDFGSGWPSLLTKCEKLQPVSSGLFIGAMGRNCRVGVGNATVTYPTMYLSGTLRADSIAWAACKLLYRHRRPPVCADRIVSGFIDRYGLEDPFVTRAMLAPVDSPAEVELLALLTVVAQSEPLHRVTCVDCFVFHGAGFYTTHLFGCGSPNVYSSQFVGVEASAFKELHRDKAWLTVDTINLMGFRYVLRQNVKSEFTASVNGSAISLQHKTVTNYSSSGPLYCLMVCVDVVLMVLNLWSSLEIARLMILPLLRTAFTVSGESEQGAVRGVVDNYKTVLTCPLYRSRPVVLLTVATQLVSWVIILPNSTIFTWSTSSQLAKVQAYLSSLRLWVLVLVVFNELWDWVVFVNEKLAYEIATRTYISSHEIIAVAALVSYAKRATVFAVTGVKYDAERQRNRDARSFQGGVTAFGNSYNPQNDGYLFTPAAALWALYEPLVVIILWSLLGIVGVLVARLALYAAWARVGRWWRRRRVMMKRKAVVPAKLTKNPEEEEDGGGGEQLFSKRQMARPPSPASSSGSIVHDRFSGDEGEEVGEDEEEEEDDEHYEYARLPLEELLNIPVRARSIVRGSLEIEAKVTSKHKARKRKVVERYIRAPFLLEYGVVLDRGQLRVRHGFFALLQPKIEVRPYVLHSMSDALESFQDGVLSRTKRA